MPVTAPRPSNRLSRAGAGLACAVAILCLTGCGTTATATGHPASGTGEATASAGTPQAGSQTSPASTVTSAPGSSPSTSTPTPAATSSQTTAGTPSPSATVTSPTAAVRHVSTAAYVKALAQQLRTFRRASAQFTALTGGAVLAEIGAAAPVYAAAAATFARTLSTLHLPAGVAARRTALEAQLKRLAYELTKVANDTDTGDVAGARAQLAATVRTDAQLTTMAARLSALASG